MERLEAYGIERERRDFETLGSLGLLEVRGRADTSSEVVFNTTPKGRRVHKLIMDQLYQALVLRSTSK